MHRSGTSAFARVVSLLGAALPKDLLGAGPGNEKGHWEPEPLVAAHDRMLAAAGSRWDDWRSLDLDRMSAARQAATRDELARLIEEQYGRALLLVLKEPRICRFVPLYRGLLARLGLEPRCVVPLRNPLAVVASLRARDGMTEGFAGLLWLRHVLQAEAETRGCPRAVVSYEALLDDWQPMVRRIAARLGLDWPRPFEEAAPEIGAFLSVDGQHHAPSRRELAAREDLPEWVKAAYEALLRLEQDPDDEAALAQLDRIRAEFDTACPTFGAAMFAELAAREARFAAEAGRLAAEAHGRISALERSVAEEELRNAELGACLEERAAQLTRAQEKIDALETSVADRHRELDDYAQRVAAISARLAGWRRGQC
jgi:hypothetical protein